MQAWRVSSACHEYDALTQKHMDCAEGKVSGAPTRRRGHLHVAGALERAIQFERLADGAGT